MAIVAKHAMKPGPEDLPNDPEILHESHKDFISSDAIIPMHAMKRGTGDLPKDLEILHE
jgi:hypothetical protein